MDVNSINSQVPRPDTNSVQQPTTNTTTATVDTASASNALTQSEEAAASALGPVFSSLLLRIFDEARSNGSSGA